MFCTICGQGLMPSGMYTMDGFHHSCGGTPTFCGFCGIKSHFGEKCQSGETTFSMPPGMYTIDCGNVEFIPMPDGKPN